VQTPPSLLTGGGTSSSLGLDFAPDSSRSGGAAAGIRAVGDGAGNAHLTLSTTTGGAATSLVERVRVLSNGYVGIGTSNPAYPLHLNGNCQIMSGGESTFKGGNTYLYIQPISGSRVRLGSYDTINGWMPLDIGEGKLYITASGYVGVGLTTPTRHFHTKGELSFTPVPTLNTVYFNLCDDTANNGASYNLYIRGLTANGTAETNISACRINADRFSVYYSSTQGISFWNTNIFSPLIDNSVFLGYTGYRWATVFAVNGTIQTSDERYKEFIPLTYGLNELMNIETIKYKWKTQAELPDTDPSKNYEYYGFKASNLKTLFPELVYDETDILQINYSKCD
jgi:hypothetical protein